jgi:transposase
MADPLQPGWFDDDQDQSACAVAHEQPVPGVARVCLPNRAQLEQRLSELDSLLPAGHRARVVWVWVQHADLRRMYAGIRALGGGSGRSAIASEMLHALWLYATLDGVGTARTVARLNQAHDGCRWICGGVQVNDHTLSDFLGTHGEAFNALLSDSVTALMAVGAVTFKRVAQKGERVRASAGAASSRRGETVEHCLEQGRAQVAAVKQQGEGDLGARSRRQPAARERAAREREERIAAALERLPEFAEMKARQGKPREQVRASTTDAEASVMKMGDSGLRPAYNGQFATDTASQVVVRVAAVGVGTDMAQLAPMAEQVVARCGQSPNEWLVDGDYPAHDQLDRAAAHTVVHAPVPKPKDPASEAHVPRTATAKPSAPGPNAWAWTRPRPSTKSGPPPPSVSTPKRASAV